MPTLNKRYKMPHWKPPTTFREYVDIKRYVTGIISSTTGEPGGTWTTQASNVVCTIIPQNSVNADILAMMPPGMVNVATDFMAMTTGVSIRSRDRIIDINGKTWDVMETKDWKTHKEALLQALEQENL